MWILNIRNTIVMWCEFWIECPLAAFNYYIIKITLHLALSRFSKIAKCPFGEDFWDKNSISQEQWKIKIRFCESNNFVQIHVNDELNNDTESRKKDGSYNSPGWWNIRYNMNLAGNSHAFHRTGNDQNMCAKIV